MADHNKSILLVEDYTLIQITQTYLLKSLGYEVHLESQGIGVCELALQHSWHAILMDIGLPDISGIEVIQSIRCAEATQNLQPRRIIILTAYDDVSVAQQCQGLGVERILRKPITRDALGEALN
jgi:CheY-like chemotaxis protein